MKLASIAMNGMNKNVDIMHLLLTLQPAVLIPQCESLAQENISFSSVFKHFVNINGKMIIAVIYVADQQNIF
jgi:hypothetical protein